MKKGCCIGCAAVLVVAVVIAGFLFYLMFGDHTEATTDISYYRALSGEVEGPNALPVLGEQRDNPCPYVLPKLAELEPYEDMRYRYQAHRMGPFEAHAYIVIVRYAEADYYARKEQALKDYALWEAEEWEKETYHMVPEFSMDGFDFRCIEGGSYPHAMLFIGTSDESREIAYIYFYDGDLDVISAGMEGFIREETGWDSIR